jgi:hypothetical protein
MSKKKRTPKKTRTRPNSGKSKKTSTSSKKKTRSAGATRGVATPTSKTKTSRTKSSRSSVAARDASPAGFDVFPGQGSAYDRIVRRLADTQDALEAFELAGRLRTHQYKNGEVDGEIVVDVERGQDAVDLARKLEQAFGMANQRGVWFQVGARFAVREGEWEAASGIVDRRKGMDEVTMYYRKMYSKDDQVRRGIFGDAFGMMEHKVIPRMEHKYGRKAQTVFVRLHWNPEGKKPRR